MRVADEKEEKEQDSLNQTRNHTGEEVFEPVQGFDRESAGYIVRFEKPQRVQRTQRKAATVCASGMKNN